MSTEIPTLDPAQPQRGDTNQLRFILDVVLRRWFMVFLFSVLGAALGVATGTYLQDDRYEYEAFADLFVKQSVWQSPVMADLGVSVFGPLTPQILLDRTNQRDLARDVARALVQEDVSGGGDASLLTNDQELESKAQEIQGRLSLEPIAELGILRVRLRSPVSEADAELLVEIAARILVDQTRYLQTDEQQQAYDIVKAQLDEVRFQLDDAEARQWAYREAMGFQTHDQVWADMERKNAELLEAAATREELIAKLAEFEAELVENGKRLPDSLGNVGEQVIADLLAELDELRRDQVQMSVVWQPEYPELMALKDEISEKKQAVLLAIGELNGNESDGSNLWGRRQELYRQVVDLNSQLTALDIRTASLEKMLSDMVGRLPELADKSFEYDQLSNETEQVQRQFNRLLEKEFEIRTALRRGTASVEWRDAVVATNYFTRRGASTTASGALGGLIGLLIAVGLAMMIEMMDTSIQTIEDVNHSLNLEVIGMIPMMKFGRAKRSRRRGGAHVVSSDEGEVDACIVTRHDPKSPISEAYRSFRTNFQFATIQSAPKTVMMTSAVPGEGKTTTAVNFAVTMADRGMRVLIVDTDLRRPNVHRVLKMERGPGLADVLRDKTDLKEVIRPTQVENLWIISSGRVPPNPSELIGSEQMDQLMKELGATFDLVVCDAPSILVVTDPMLLATHVDSVVLVVAVARARRDTIQRAKKLLETANPRIAGAVLNGIEATARHYYYYYYYYDDRGAPSRRRWYQSA